MINTIISALIGYLFGSIQTAYILGRTVKNIDIREHGSGNAGTSNATTILGIKYGIIVGIVDILKGILSIVIVRAIYPETPQLAFLAGLMAIIGHMFPFYLRFRGGKGVATLVGMTIGLNWKIGLTFALLVIVPALITDYIVSGSFTTFVGLPILAYLQEHSLWILAICLILTAVCFYLHRHNIQRIRAREELTISSVLFKKKES